MKLPQKTPPTAVAPVARFHTLGPKRLSRQSRLRLAQPRSPSLPRAASTDPTPGMARRPTECSQISRVLVGRTNSAMRQRNRGLHALARSRGSITHLGLATA